MDLAHALRLAPSASDQAVSLVGAGGKSTALFQLARQLAHEPSPTVIVTATAHLGTWQITEADRHIIATRVEDLAAIFKNELHGIALVTGEIKDDRTSPINPLLLNWLRENTKTHHIPLLIEADGSRAHPLKAPAAHEPAIPEFTDTVIVVAGLSALGRPLTDVHVHRFEIFSQLSGLELNENITSGSILRVLIHPFGGLKNIPSTARRVVLLNQADTPGLLSIGGTMAQTLLDHFDAVIVGSLQNGHLQTIERTAGIILAAGESKRFGRPKQLLDWHGKPFVRNIAETALHAGLGPVVVVTGSRAAEIETALNGLPVEIVHNPDYQHGQSTSIKTGIRSLPEKIGSAVFLLADQPQIPSEVIRALAETHTRELPPILAPLVLEERRANPVLFDRTTFRALLQLTGDIGGRGIFDQYRVEYLPWLDDILLLDVDQPEDYQRLKDLE